MKTWIIAFAAAICAAMAYAQSTTQTVQVPFTVPAQPATVPVTVTVTPTSVTIGDVVIPVPTASTPVCGAAPQSTTSTSACPVGQIGGLVSTTTYGSAPYPTCWVPTTTQSGLVCTPVVVPPSVYARPAGNTGTGLYVAGGRLNNPDGTEFRIRGVNRNHYDSNSDAGIAKAGFNAVREFLGTQYGRSNQDMINYMSVYPRAGIVPVITLFNGKSDPTCDRNGTATLQANVVNYVSNASSWTAFNKTGVLNIANEWGPSGSAVWRDQYISAISALRAAGYTMPLLIDSGGCGQDQADLLNYAASVAAADPQSNVIFSTHIYGGTPNAAAAQSWLAKLGALSKGNPALVFVVGEFGPGRNIGPSPTMLAPDDVIAAAEANGIGWMGWAWDDGNLAGWKADDNWFSMTNGNNGGLGSYNTSADLTKFGLDIVSQLSKYPPVKAKVF